MAGTTSPAMTLYLAFLLQLRRLVAIVPPGFRNAAEVAWFGGRAAEQTPIGDPVRPFVPVRNPVAPGTDDAVERPAGGRQFGPGLGGDDDIDQRIDRWVGEAGNVLRALGGGGLRGKIAAQRIARRLGKTETLHRDVEIEAVDAGAGLPRVTDAQRCFDAERNEISNVGLMGRR